MAFFKEKQMGSFQGSHKMGENLQNKIYVGRLKRTVDAPSGGYRKTE